MKTHHDPQNIDHDEIIVINPINMDQNERFILRAFLISNHPRDESEPRQKFFNNVEVYEIDGTKFKLTHHILWRRSNLKGKYAGQSRYEIIDPELFAKGTKGKIYKLLASLILTDNDLIIKIPHHARIVKVQSIEHAYKEYRESLLVDHLHIKSPTIANNTSFLVGHYIQGNNLDLHTISNYTAEVKFKLCIVLLNAFKNQILTKDIVHGDLLNFSNILFDNENFAINFVDFAGGEFNRALGKAEDIMSIIEVIYAILSSIENTSGNIETINHFLLVLQEIMQLAEFNELANKAFLLKMMLSTDNPDVSNINMEIFNFFNEARDKLNSVINERKKLSMAPSEEVFLNACLDLQSATEDELNISPLKLAGRYVLTILKTAKLQNAIPSDKLFLVANFLKDTINIMQDPFNADFSHYEKSLKQLRWNTLDWQLVCKASLGVIATTLFQHSVYNAFIAPNVDATNSTYDFMVKTLMISTSIAMIAGTTFYAKTKAQREIIASGRDILNKAKKHTKNTKLT